MQERHRSIARMPATCAIGRPRLTPGADRAMRSLRWPRRHVGLMLTGYVRACLAMVADVQGWAVDRPDLDGRVLDTYPAPRAGGRAVPEAALVSPVVVAV